MGLFYIFILLCYDLIRCNNGERLHSQIYSSIEGGAACFRRLNGTHQAGCSSSNKGAIGVVHFIKNISDAQWAVYNSSAGPYMAVVNTAVFHDVLEVLIGNPQNVAGILLYENETIRTNSFSQESMCPNQYASAPGTQCPAKNKQVWNVDGTGLIRRDIPFPIFYLPASQSKEIVKIRKCHDRYNLDFDTQIGRPLCSIQLNSFMWASVNSVVCRRRSAANALLSSTKVCDPLGDNNVYYSLFPREKGTGPKKKVILVTSRIDSASLFDGIAPGAASSVVGMVTLISAATALSKMMPAADSNKYDVNVLWTLLNGEAFDYIGSQRVAYDLRRGAWPPDAPVALAQLGLHVEIGQIGGALAQFKHNASWPLYAFTPNDPTSQNIIQFLVDMSNNAQKYNMTIEQFTDNLPPSSLHSFRRILKNVTDIGLLPELLFTDHGSSFTNLYYNSVMDDYEKIDYKFHNISIGTDGAFVPTDELLAKGNMTDNEPQVKIARVATALSQTLYQQVAKKPYDGDLTVSAHMIDELLYCFLENKMCRLLTAADYAHDPSEDAASARPAQLYVGVTSWTGGVAMYAGHMLALLSGEHLALNKTECNAATSSSNSYLWLHGWNRTGVCIETNMNFSEAVSPAFTIPDYDFTSGEYSTWTESVWQTLSARVFVSAGGGGARIAVCAGAAATVLAAVLTYWLQKYGREIFAYPAPTPIGNGHAATGILHSVNC